MASKRSSLRSLMYMIGFLDMMAVSIFYPILSKMVQNRGASPTVAGLVGSVYGILQTFSSTPLGRVSDEHGRKLGLLLSYVIPGIGYLIGGTTTSIVGILVSRIPPGLFKHGITISKACLADITEPAERPSVLGTFTAFSNAGFIVGPLIGGYLADRDPTLTTPFLTSGILFLGIALVIQLTVPETSSGVNEEQVKKSNHRNGSYHSNSDNVTMVTEGVTPTKETDTRKVHFSWRTLQYLNFFEGIQWIEHVDLIAERFLLTFSMLLFRQNYPLFLQQFFNVDFKTLGKILSFNGLVATAAAFLVRYVVKLYSPALDRLMQHALVLLALTITFIALSPTLSCAVLLLVPLSCASSILRVLHIDTSITRARPEEKGAIVGLSNSIASLSRMLSPTLAGLLQEHSFTAPGFCSAALATMALGIVVVIPPCRSLPWKQRTD